MAYEEALSTRTFEAAGDLSTKDGCFVIEDANGRVAVAGAGAQAIGVLRNKPAGVGHAATVIRAGTANMVAGEAIAKGDEVTSDAQGRCQVVALGEPALGTARTVATAAGQRVAVELHLQGRPNAS